MTKELETKICDEIIGKYPDLKNCLRKDGTFDVRKSKKILEALKNDSELTQKFNNFKEIIWIT